MTSTASRPSVRIRRGLCVTLAVVSLALAAAVPGAACTGVVVRQGGTLVCAGDGAPFRFVGYNLPFLNNLAAAGIPAGAVDSEIVNQLTALQARGGTVVRLFLPWSGKDSQTVIDDLRHVLTLADENTPDLRFIIALTDFYLGPSLVVRDDATECDPAAGSFPDTAGCQFDWENPQATGAARGAVVLRQRWFTGDFRLHYKPFAVQVAGDFKANLTGVDNQARPYHFRAAQILAWELGNELKVLHRSNDPALPTGELGALLDFAYEMGQAIQATGAPQMVTTGFLSLWHATNGTINATNYNAAFDQMYRQRDAATPSPFSFGTVHGYNADWTLDPADGPGESGTNQAGGFFGLDWFPRNNVPFVVEEFAFTGASDQMKCTESFPDGTIGSYPGGRWGDVTLGRTDLDRSTDVQIAIDKLYDEVGAAGVMQWAFNSGGFFAFGSDACRGMDDAAIFLIGDGNPFGHTDFQTLAAVYTCRGMILAQPGADVYVKSVDAVTGDPVTLTAQVRNGGTGATIGGQVCVDFFLGTAADPVDSTPEAQACTGDLLAGAEATLTASWTPDVEGDLHVAAVVNRSGGVTNEGVRSCNNRLDRAGTVAVVLCPTSGFRVIEGGGLQAVAAAGTVCTAPAPVLRNPGMETEFTSQFGFIDQWGPNGGWAFHSQFPRPGNETLGTRFGFYSAGTSESVGQVLEQTFLPGETYTFSGTFFGGGDATGTVPLEIGYAPDDLLVNFIPLESGVFSLTGATSWIHLSGVDHTVAGIGAPEAFHPIMVRLGGGADGGSDDIWFDDLEIVTSGTTTPPPGPVLVDADIESVTTSQFGFIDGWGPAGAWAFHSQFPRAGNETLGTRFGYYSAGTTETVGQVSGLTFAPGTTYQLSAAVVGGGNAIGKVPFEIGYTTDGTLGGFILLARGVVDVTGASAWQTVTGVSYTTGVTGPELGQPVVVRFGDGAAGGDSDIWFDNVALTAQ